MKKIMLTIIAMTISSLAFAEYSMKVPMEVAQGGTLDNGSIKFVTASENGVENPSNPAPTYDMAVTIFVQNIGDNVTFSGVSQPGFSNAESSYFNMTTNQLFIGNTYENYFWGNPEYASYAPNVGGLIQFDGKGVDCKIASVSNSGSGTLYTCENDVEFSAGSELINVVLYRKTN